MIIVGSFLPEPFWLVSATKFTRVCREPALLCNQIHSRAACKRRKRLFGWRAGWHNCGPCRV